MSDQTMVEYGRNNMKPSPTLFNINSLLSPFFSSKDENSRAMVYYLEHATRCQLSFPVLVNERQPVQQIRFVSFLSFPNFEWLQGEGASFNVEVKSAPCDHFYRNFSFIDVPIESCGKASPLRVALQASAPDILLILLR